MRKERVSEGGTSEQEDDDNEEEELEEEGRGDGFEGEEKSKCWRYEKCSFRVEITRESGYNNS